MRLPEGIFPIKMNYDDQRQIENEKKTKETIKTERQITARL